MLACVKCTSTILLRPFLAAFACGLSFAYSHLLLQVGLVTASSEVAVADVAAIAAEMHLCEMTALVFLRLASYASLRSLCTWQSFDRLYPKDS